MKIWVVYQVSMEDVQESPVLMILSWVCWAVDDENKSDYIFDYYIQINSIYTYI